MSQKSSIPQAVSFVSQALKRNSIRGFYAIATLCNVTLGVTLALFSGSIFPLSIGAGEGNRTLVISLEGFCSTIELHPQRAP
jgi:hypothetical protein